MKIIVNGEVAQIPTGGGGAVSSIPTGGIIMWSGSTVPDGWALCNGENGTPDLRGRFVLGVSETHMMGETGGSEEVTLTTNQMPEHLHTWDKPSGTSFVKADSTGTVKVRNIANGVIKTNTSYTGSSQPHPNMPPYYTLAYIMKL